MDRSEMAEVDNRGQALDPTRQRRQDGHEEERNGTTATAGAKASSEISTHLQGERAREEMLTLY